MPSGRAFFQIHLLESITTPMKCQNLDFQIRYSFFSCFISWRNPAKTAGFVAQRPWSSFIFIPNVRRVEILLTKLTALVQRCTVYCILWERKKTNPSHIPWWYRKCMQYFLNLFKVTLIKRNLYNQFNCLTAQRSNMRDVSRLHLSLLSVTEEVQKIYFTRGFLQFITLKWIWLWHLFNACRQYGLLTALHIYLLYVWP